MKLSANCNWTPRRTCQNPFSSVVSMFIIEGVYGRRRQGLDHKEPKHLKGVLHNQIQVVRYTAVNNKGEMQEIAIVYRGRGGFVFSVTPFFLGGGGVLESSRKWGEGWVGHRGGRFTIRGGGGFSSEEF